MSRIIYTMGIDPGGTTGWGIIGVNSRTIYQDYPGRISEHVWGKVTGNYTTQVLELMRIAAEWRRKGPLAIALESFVVRKLEAELSPVAIGARIQMCVDTSYTLCPLFYQTPEQALTTATDERLKIWGLYPPGPDHPKDGTRHAITFIRRAKANPKLRIKAWGSANGHR